MVKVLKVFKYQSLILGKVVLLVGCTGGKYSINP